MSVSDRQAMELALSLGRRGLGRCWPNPAVGCVLVKDGRIIGRGWTQPGGRPHGEVVALAQAGAAARGADAFVTLEPCAHHGHTPPCAAALVDAGVARVVSAIEDPDARVSGRGHDMLRAAGIDVSVGLCAEQATQDHAGFLNRVRHGRPFVTLKLATSFDGRIATATGESRWITGPDARRVVHGMRMRHDAVLIGGGTARADDPMLDVRGFGEVQQPVRIVLSRRLSLPLDGRLARTAGQVPLWLIHGTGEVDAALQAQWLALGARLFCVPVGADGALDLGAALGALGDAGLTRILCEGGGTIAASLLYGRLADQIVGFTAGLALGADGLPSLGSLGLSTLADGPRFSLLETRIIGRDTMQVWAPSTP